MKKAHIGLDFGVAVFFDKKKPWSIKMLLVPARFILQGTNTFETATKTATKRRRRHENR